MCDRDSVDTSYNIWVGGKKAQRRNQSLSNFRKLSRESWQNAATATRAVQSADRSHPERIPLRVDPAGNIL